MSLPIGTEVRLLLVLAGMLYLPGSALLMASNGERRWAGLQWHILAVGLSVAFYPTLFYTVRFLLPQVTLNAYGVGAILLLAAGVTVWGWRRRRVELFRLDRLEWTAVTIILLTFISRLWQAHTLPFPAWSDSLHHTLLTQLTAQQGQLPYTLEPFFPNVLEMYHLGLYALSGTVEMLAQAPAHSALLWTAQFLNGLCGIGVYLALDRYAGRRGAVVRLAVAGLFSAHPALWVNWGRFTQLSSLTIFLIAWVLTVESAGVYKKSEGSTVNAHSPTPEEQFSRKEQIWLIFFSGMSTAAVFLFHFRVAIFYFLLLSITVVHILWAAPSWSQRRHRIKTVGAVGGVTLLIILPVLWEAAAAFLASRAAPAPIDPNIQEQFRQNYYVFPLSSIPYLAAPIWLLLGSAAAGMIGLIRRNVIIITNLIWVVLLIIVGNLYLLNIPVLNVTNFGAILIMLYLPIGLIIGAGATELWAWLPKRYHRQVTNGFILLILIGSVPAVYVRATTIEPYRHFMSEADIAAMDWINENVPADATFAINTYFWFPNFAHGTDAGYWIPYQTGRNIVTSAMLSDGLPSHYLEEVRQQSVAAEALETNPDAVAELYNMGVHYIYVGARGDFSGTGLQTEFLLQSDRVELLFENEGAAILHIKPENN